MDKINLTIDINEHISNLTCEINVIDGVPTAYILFINLGFGTLTAIKLKATGYNSFGDVVAFNGKKQFIIVIQDISIEKNACAEKLKATLPVSDIRKLDVEEYQLCYEGGMVLTYEGKNCKEIEVEEFLNVGNECETIEAIHDVISPKIRFLPKEIAEGWICGCGRFNHIQLSNCTNCDTTKEEVFKLYDSSYIEIIKRQHEANENERIAHSEKDFKEKQKKKRIRILIVVVAVVLTIIIVYFIAHAIMLSNRSTYGSADEMRNALQGTYTYYSEITGKASRQIVISGNKLTYKYGLSDLRDFDYDIREWNYNEGTIKTFETLVVMKNGALQEKDGDVYEKGGYMSDDSLFSNNSSNVYNDLKIKIDKVYTDYGYCKCKGSVKNNGTKSYNYVKIKGSFKDKDGNILDTDWTYVVGSEGLAPSETKTFELSVPANSKIDSCSVSLIND